MPDAGGARFAVSCLSCRGGRLRLATGMGGGPELSVPLPCCWGIVGSAPGSG